MPGDADAAVVPTPMPGRHRRVSDLPLSWGGQELVNYKAELALQRFDEAAVKVGLFNSHNRGIQELEAAASMAIPGDSADIRRPVRSATYEALTPGGNDRNIGIGGGGLVGRALGAARRAGRETLRCPAGFENGGRYANRTFSNCGARVFEAPGSNETGLGRLPTSNLRLIGLLQGQAEQVTAGQYLGAPIAVRRNAMIPRVGGDRSRDRDRSISGLVEAIGGGGKSQTFMVRRDGVILRPTASIDKLASLRNNPDIENASFVVGVATPSNMGEAELPLLWRTKARSVTFALPDRGRITVESKRTLTAGERRKLARAWAAGYKEEEFDYGGRMRRLVDSSDGALTYSEDFPNSDLPNSVVQVRDSNGRQASVRKWVYDTYLSGATEGRGKWSVVAASADSTSTDGKIDSIEKAVASLKNGGTIDDVPGQFLDEALRRSRAYRVRPIRPGVEELQGRDGDRYFRVDQRTELGGLGARVAADVRTQLGLPPASVRFAGVGRDRKLIISAPSNLGRSSREGSLDSVAPDQLLRLAVADFLTDQRNRNPSSLIPLGAAGRDRLFVVPDQMAAGVGLSADELAQRRRAVLGRDYVPSPVLTSRIEALSPPQRKSLVKLYDRLITQANDFKWKDYQSRLGIDGELSAAEEAHLKIVRALYDQRLTSLRSARDRALLAFGLEIPEKGVLVDAGRLIGYQQKGQPS